MKCKRCDNTIYNEPYKWSRESKDGYCSTYCLLASTNSCSICGGTLAGHTVPEHGYPCRCDTWLGMVDNPEGGQ